MSFDVSVDELLRGAPETSGESHPVIDVRSPGEFARGHVPGAINVPLFDDQQRAEIGTAYKRIGRETAVQLGVGIAGQRSQWIVDSVARVAHGRQPMVYCWRGGMRSEGVAGLLSENGYQPRRVRGGYKAYRRKAHDAFEQPYRIVLLAGPTGAGKTRILQQLKRAGQQVIDLEGLANHRGSAFGGIDQPPQPTTEQFENELFSIWRSFDPDRLVWLEGESKAIGTVRLPDALWQQMMASPMILVDCPRQARIEYLIEMYGGAKPEFLAQAVTKISKRLGGQRTKDALQAVERGDVAEVASLTLQYYDRAYQRSRECHGQAVCESFEVRTPGQVDNLQPLIELGERLVLRGV